MLSPMRDSKKSPAPLFHAFAKATQGLPLRLQHSIIHRPGHSGDVWPLWFFERRRAGF